MADENINGYQINGLHNQGKYAGKPVSVIVFARTPERAIELARQKDIAPTKLVTKRLEEVIELSKWRKNQLADS